MKLKITNKSITAIIVIIVYLMYCVTYWSTVQRIDITRRKIIIYCMDNWPAPNKCKRVRYTYNKKVKAMIEEEEGRSVKKILELRTGIGWHKRIMLLKGLFNIEERHTEPGAYYATGRNVYWVKDSGKEIAYKLSIKRWE
jgi:hypothetical protein